MPPSIPLPTSAEASRRAALSESPNSTAKQAAARTRTKRVVVRKEKSKTSSPSKNERKSADEESAANIENGSASISPYGSSMLNPTAAGGGMPYGMYSSPYYGAMSGMSPMLGGPFSGLYQVLFGVQNVVFSINQVVQVLGVNQHALQQALDSLTNMVDRAIATFYELRALEAQENAKATEEQLRRKRRLRALRWALVVGTSWLVVKIIRHLTMSRRRRRLTNHRNQGNQSLNTYGGFPSLATTPNPLNSMYSSPLGGLYGMTGSNPMLGTGFQF